MDALLTAPISFTFHTGPTTGDRNWVELYAGGLPLPDETVELMLQGETFHRRGRFLWNGFWLLDDERIISGGRVARWRHESL